jgi:hypothetical protein
MDENSKFTLPFDELTIEDVPQVGGKNASLGEMISTLSKKGVPVPGGYAITAAAYRFFIASTGLQEFIKESLDGLNTKNLTQLSVVAEKIRQKIIATPFPEKLESAIKKAHQTAKKSMDLTVILLLDHQPQQKIYLEHRLRANMKHILMFEGLRIYYSLLKKLWLHFLQIALSPTELINISIILK